MFIIVAVVVLLIIHGSLYPWVFENPHLSASPLHILLRSWNVSFHERRFLLDIAVNIAIYVPLGMSTYLALRRFRSRTIRILLPLACGALLSATLEMIQLFTPHRQCSAIDLVNNILGSGLGIIAGSVLTRITDIPDGEIHFGVRNPGAVALLLCWASFLVFPVFPVVQLIAWKAKLLAFGHTPLSPIPALLDTAEWFAVGRLLLASGARSPGRWLFISLLFLPVQFAIVNRSPTAADFAGLAMALVLSGFIGGRSGADRFAAILLLLSLTLRGLDPFHFEGAKAFEWVPFQGLLDTDWQDGIRVLLGKLFQYGASICLLHRSGLPLVRATGIVTVILAAIETLQTRIPGHVPEITDPLLAVLLYIGLRAVAARHLYQQPARR